MQLTGWMEENGRLLDRAEIEIFSVSRLSACGGEFLLETDDCFIRDKYHIMPGNPKGKPVITAEPIVSGMSLDEAIQTAVSLRASDDAVTTLSGGVDSSLVAALAGLPCIAVGLSGSHDLIAAQQTAEILDLPITVKEIGIDDIRAALDDVLEIIPRVTPLDVEIGITGYFIAALAKETGAKRILTGQAADELFGGYARYGRSSDLRADLEADFAGLVQQRERDAAVASHFGVWYSLPFMDERVVRASRTFSPEELVKGDLRKIAIRSVAAKHLPEEIAWRPKKAMQYGSGISSALAKIAKSEGCKGCRELIQKLVPDKL
ncbi:asparagine synthase [Methanocorpusculum labreanum Z]|uniref:Asparagine synthase n=1 Tax=Methanocorpusculum labreanum (strain ATCC 43576 / DSM 4855 / Z) TaxID=410358 RepID=A2SRP9_METLZ|nr:asparagine synthase-related protein [Methanocorpusculum labreanum]ABN07005.1 asparagine synthase [Methanocorpusculum labreanum Z]